MNYFCNPVNINYRYQFNEDPNKRKMQICREAADPSMIYFQGKYYIFASMTLSVWVSEDMTNWESFRLPENLPLYDYAPDVSVIGEYVYFSASKRREICNYYRTKDIFPKRLFHSFTYHSISSMGTAFSFRRTSLMVPFLTLITRSAIAVKAELWVIISTVMPDFRLASCNSCKIAFPV